MFKKIISKKLFRYIMVAFCVVLGLGAYLFFENSSSIKIDYEEIKTPINEEIPGETGGTTSEGITQIGSNDDLILYYDKDIGGIKVVERLTKKEWTSYFPLESYQTGQTQPTKLIRQNLKQICSLSFSNLKAGIEAISSSDSSVVTTTKLIKNGISINFDFADISISLEVVIWIDDHGLSVSVPKNKIKEGSEYKIIALDVLPSFGCTTKGDKGLILYPDGSGSIYNLSKQGNENANPFIKSIYSPQKTNLDELIDNDRNGVKNIAMPSYGIIRNNTGFVTYISEGAESSKIILAPYGHITKTSRIYTNITYRNANIFKGPDGNELSEYDEELIAGNLIQHYFFKAKQDIGYIDLAGMLQKYLIDTKKLKADNDQNSKAFIEFICASGQKTLLYKDTVKTTSFNDANSIIKDLADNGIGSLNVSLLGWQGYGYMEVPTNFKIANKIGGEKELTALKYTIEKTKGMLFLNSGLMWANADNNSFNKGSDIINDFVEVPLTNNEKDVFLLNPFIAIKRYEKSLFNSFAYKGKFSVSLDDIGRIVYADLDKKKAVTKEQSVSIYKRLLDKLGKGGINTAFQTGNSYVLPYADVIYNLPDNDSDEMFFDYEVPFYQAVIHAYVQYSGDYCGNMSSDFTKQKLRWAEYGEMPYFILTKEDSSDLRDTRITDVFGTMYEKNKGLIIETINEFEKELGHLKGVRITGHQKISNEVFVTTYENGDLVYVNYSQDSFKIDEKNTLMGKTFKCIKEGIA